MADSFSALLNLRLQQTGGNDNTWGDLLNSDTITPLENAIAGRAIHAVIGGTLDLSASPLVEQVHVFSGVLSSDLTIIVPALNKRMLVQNATSGAFAMLMKTSGGSAIAIPQGTVKDVFSNSGGVARTDFTEVGEIKHFGGASVPAGYLECDGSAVSRANYPDLFAVIGTIWGAGNGATTFNLPDLKTAGRFLRSRSGSVAAGTYQADTVGAHNHPGSGSVSGSVSLNIVADGAWTPSISISDPGHNHQQQNASSKTSPFGTGTPANLWSNPNQNTLTSSDVTGVTAFSNTAPTHSHSGSSGSFSSSVTVVVSNNTGTIETRPINASALCCIRY